MIARKSHSIVLALPLALCGCSSASERFATTELVSPPPQNYREIIVSRSREVFKDLTDIKDAGISAPFAGRSLLGASSTICVRANARDEKTNAYTQRKVATFTFRNRELVEIEDKYAPATCMRAVYEPFPELEQATSPAPPAAPLRPKRTRPS